MEYLKTVGADGIRLLAKLDDPEAAPRSLKQLPEEVDILHRIWEQQYVEIEGGVRVLDPKEMPEAARRVESPYETEAATPLRRLMCNCSNQKIGKMTQRTTEPGV